MFLSCFITLCFLSLRSSGDLQLGDRSRNIVYTRDVSCEIRTCYWQRMCMMKCYFACTPQKEDTGVIVKLVRDGGRGARPYFFERAPQIVWKLGTAG